MAHAILFFLFTVDNISGFPYNPAMIVEAPTSKPSPAPEQQEPLNVQEQQEQPQEEQVQPAADPTPSSIQDNYNSTIRTISSNESPGPSGGTIPESTTGQPDDLPRPTNTSSHQNAKHPATKQCSRCHNQLPASTRYFYKHPLNRDGFCSYCITCTSTISKSRYRARKQESLDYESTAKIGMAGYIAAHSNRLKEPPPILDGSQLKRCCVCEKEYPNTLEYWHHNVIAKDGLSSQCKKCYSSWRKRNLFNKHCARLSAIQQRELAEGTPSLITSIDFDYDHFCKMHGWDIEPKTEPNTEPNTES